MTKNSGVVSEQIETSFSCECVSMWLDLFINNAPSAKKFGLKYAGGNLIGAR